MVLLGEVRGGTMPLNLAEIIFRDLKVMGSVGASKRHLEQAVELVAAGELRPVVAHALPWDGVDGVMEAYRLVKSGQVLGRVVLDFAPSW